MSKAPSPAPAPRTGPPVTDYTTVWVFHKDVPEVQGRTGFVQLLKTDAAALIAAGHAENPYTAGSLRYITAAPPPAPTPAPSPTPAPPAPVPETAA